MKAAILASVILGCILFGPRLRAQVYECTAADGARGYQDQPCKPGQRQRVIDLPGHASPVEHVPSASAPPPSAASAAADTTDALPVPVATPPGTPLPVLYTCVGAVNGEHYLARAPRLPYLVPLGVLGYPPQSLAQAYGGVRGAGASAPELAHPRAGGPRIATGMTEVQDVCLPATHAQVCSFVQKEYAENHRKLRMAMPHEAPPLAARERKLTAQLANC